MDPKMFKLTIGPSAPNPCTCIANNTNPTHSHSASLH